MNVISINVSLIVFMLRIGHKLCEINYHFRSILHMGISQFLIIIHNMAWSIRIFGCILYTYIGISCSRRTFPVKLRCRDIKQECIGQDGAAKLLEAVESTFCSTHVFINRCTWPCSFNKVGWSYVEPLCFD